MSETASAGQHEFPPHVHELHSPDESVVAYGSPRGAQLWAAEINGHDAVRALDSPHSIVTDWRTESPNSYEEGETAKPGGSFPSFGGGEVVERDGRTRKMPVHGPYSSAGYQHEVTDETTPSKLALHGRADARTAPFFRAGERFTMDRSMEAANGALALEIKITNEGDEETVPSEVVEHLYLNGGNHALLGERAAILKADGTTVSPKSLQQTPPGNGNAIDMRFGAELTGTPGEVAFLPEGPDGHVVVINAYVTGPDGTTTPAPEFCLYRYEDTNPENTDPAKNDWTAIEPVAKDVSVPQGESLTLRTVVRTFESVAEYQAARRLVP